LISKQQYEAQLQQIFRLLLENRTQEEIAHELNISTRTVARYSLRIDQRYGDIQPQKTDDTLFTVLALQEPYAKIIQSLRNQGAF
jgi:predicted transcriptional regulator